MITKQAFNILQTRYTGSYPTVQVDERELVLFLSKHGHELGIEECYDILRDIFGIKKGDIVIYTELTPSGLKQGEPFLLGSTEGGRGVAIIKDGEGRWSGSAKAGIFHFFIFLPTNKLAPIYKAELIKTQWDF